MSKSIKIFADGSAVTEIGGVNTRWQDDFGGSALNYDFWDIISNTGGITFSVTASRLTVAMGTTNGADLLLISKENFTCPCDMIAIFSMSQRIVGNVFEFGLIEVDANGLPVVHQSIPTDFQNRATARLQGTVATAAILAAMAQGSTAELTVTTATTFNSSASMADYLLELRDDNIAFSGQASNSTAVKNASSVRLTSQVPEPNKIYKAYMRFLNNAVPASNTNVIIDAIRVLDHQELPVEIVGGRGQSTNAASVPVVVTSIPTTSVNENVTAATGGIALTKRLVSSAATTNGDFAKATAGRLYQITGYNAAATMRFLKLYNKATAPTVGTDVPIITIALPPTANFPPIDFDAIGYYFSTGIAFAITGAVADADTTAIAAADIIGMNVYYA